MNKTKLAVIGTGGLAQNQHIPNIYKSDVAELTALCDLRGDVLKELGECYSVKRLETDYKKILASADIEGVVIATREDSHVPLTLEALAAGKHVYVEKPLAETTEACEQVLRAQRESALRVAVGMNRRCAPAYRYAREMLLKNGGAQNMFYRIADTYSLNWGIRFGGGKRMIHELCHIFDILRFFAGSEVTEVYCRSGRQDDESLLLVFASGATATLLSSGYASWQTPKEHFEAVAAQGMLVVEEFVEVRNFGLSADDPDVKCFAGHFHPFREQAHVAELERRGYPALTELRKEIFEQTERLSRLSPLDPDYSRQKDTRLPLINYSVDKGWQAAIDNFAECIRSGAEQISATAVDGLRAVEITQAALRSREIGQPVKVG
ncbi:Gfo/Idh/MocA family oxidoreductase [Geminisphaera colitermitum]|uniref:Gfo/Idh/MocA family oxidoreductase n=1 Tax=Geminisphaera colitermitum TaxID=1148786 RepID=UPI000158D494|nr:Gfo/Idh/MocA family oxidoreductase [Geminisphaera colitermitum]